MNPQSLNRYAYVHNNPLSMIDPTGLDCVYIEDDETMARIVRGDCLKKNDGGIHVNGTINPESFKLTAGEDGNSLTFNFQSSDTGMATVFQTNLSSLSSSGSSFGSWGAAVNIFSQVANNPGVQMVSTTRGIASFYGASAAFAAGGLSLAALLPRVPAAAEVAQQFGRSLAQNPEVLNFLRDASEGYTPGPAPFTWGGAAGAVAAYVQRHWSEVTQGVRDTYQQVKASVPH